MSNYLFNRDRNFNDDIVDQSYYYVVTHNDLISKANHDLTARELKMMDFVISKIKPDDRNFNIIRLRSMKWDSCLDIREVGRIILI